MDCYLEIEGDNMKSRKEHMGVVSPSEWKSIVKQTQQDWKRVKKQYKGKSFCNHSFGEPSSSVKFPAAYIEATLKFPNGVTKKASLFFSF